MQVTDGRLIALVPGNPRLVRVVFRVSKSVVMIYVEAVQLALHQSPIEEHIVIQCEYVLES